MVEIPESTSNIPEIIRFVNADDKNGVKTLLLTGSSKVDEIDENGMTALQHAAYKGQLEMCKLLIEHGANVNTDSHEHHYSTLHFAAISGNVDVTRLLLVSGAKTYYTNTIKRTAAQMAGYVGNHAVVALINNYVPKKNVDYYTQPNGLETESKLPPDAAGPLYDLIMQSNLHPVYIAICLRKSNILLSNLTKVHNVLNLLCEKEAKRSNNVNEVLSMKYHYLGYVIATLQKEWERVKDTTDITEEAIFESVMKKWLKAREPDLIEDILEYYIQDAVKAFPYKDMPLFMELLRNMFGDISNASPLSTLNGAINGRRAFKDDQICSTCGMEKKVLKSCSKCKMVHYCDKICQKLHWSNHKKCCDQLLIQHNKVITNQDEEKQ